MHNKGMELFSKQRHANMVVVHGEVAPKTFAADCLIVALLWQQDYWLSPPCFCRCYPCPIRVSGRAMYQADVLEHASSMFSYTKCCFSFALRIQRRYVYSTRYKSCMFGKSTENTTINAYGVIFFLNCCSHKSDFSFVEDFQWLIE